MTDLAKQCMEAIVLYTDMTVPHPFMLRPEKNLFDLAPQCRESLANSHGTCKVTYPDEPFGLVRFGCGGLLTDFCSDHRSPDTKFCPFCGKPIEVVK